MVMQFIPPTFLSAAAVPFSATYVGFIASGNAAGTSATVEGFSIGAPTSSRLVALTVHWLRVGGASLTSAVINGAPATILIQSTGSNTSVGIIYAMIPVGATAAVSLTFSAAITAGSCRFGVYRIVGQKQNLPYSSAISPNPGGDTNRTIALSAPPEGIVMIAATGTNGTAIAGLTPAYTYAGGNTEQGKSGFLTPTALAESVSYSTNCRCMVGAAWV